MKNLFLSLAVIATLTVVSCKKTEEAPAADAAVEAPVEAVATDSAAVAAPVEAAATTDAAATAVKDAAAKGADAAAAAVKK